MRMSSSLRLRLLLLTCLLIVQGCQFALSLWVVTGSNARHLMFGISDLRDGGQGVRLRTIQVYRCVDIYWRGAAHGSYPPDSKLVWNAASESDNRATPTIHFSYGRTPTGLKDVVEPHALQIPGCYFVRVYASDAMGDDRSAAVGLRVLQDGSIEQMSRRDEDRLFRQREPI
jgi:hypothetical protein